MKNVRLILMIALFTLLSGIANAEVLGIDVSAYQGTINWASVHNAGYNFSFAKATEGIGFTSTTFVSNMNNGNANGMLMGAYHFARPELNPNGAADEANYFVSVA